MRKATLFKQCILAKEILLLPVVHDALCAKVAAQAGFKAIAAAGYTNTAALLGQPDVFLLTLTEMVDAAWRIADAVLRGGQEVWRSMCIMDGQHC